MAFVPTPSALPAVVGPPAKMPAVAVASAITDTRWLPESRA